MYFALFCFASIGLLSGIYSLYLLIVSVPLWMYLFFYKKQKRLSIYSLLVMILFLVVVYIVPKVENGTYELYGVVVKSKENYFLLLTLKGKFYVYSKNNGYNVFTIMKVKGTASDLSFSHYEGSYDFKSYLKSNGVFSTFKISELNIILNPPNFIDKIKSYAFYSLNDKSKLIASSLLFQESMYSSDIGDDLSSLGIMNVFSLSGFHISFMFRIIKVLVPQKKEKQVDIFAIIVLVILLLFSNFSYGIRRAFLLFILSFINSYSKYKVSYLNRVSIVALILLLFEPYSLLNPSFYYPFPFLFYLAIFPAKTNKKKKNQLFLFFIKVQIFYLPYHLFNGTSFSLLTIPLQFIFGFISHFLFIISFLLLLVPPIGYLFNYLVTLVSYLLVKLNNGYLILFVSNASVIFLIFYYLLLIIVAFLRGYNYKKHSLLIMRLLAISLVIPFIPNPFPHYELTFIDVGQGDSTLIRNRYENILIDTGGNKSVDLATECLIPYFRKNSIYSLTAVLITHTDYDHNGALESLCSNFKVGNVYYPNDFVYSNDYTLNIGSLSFRNYNIYSLSSDTSDNNYTSGVYSTEIRKNKILITGDAPKEIEKKIIEDNPELSCDYLKIGHHGSSTSSDKSFIKQMNPKLAVISCGENNRYGHPTKQTLATLEQLKVNYRRTDKEGTITISL